MDVNQGESFSLPENVLATFGNGTKKTVSVTWNKIDTSKTGQFIVNGVIQDTNQKVTQTINIVEKKQLTQPTVDPNKNENNPKPEDTNTLTNPDPSIDDPENNTAKTSDNNSIFLLTAASLLALSSCIFLIARRNFKNKM
ncbi:Ig-like domain-containing protein [Clostridium sp. SHJSY1]|nr:Ig-like domain-containing protein [Clostridium sp. SHJSY1]